ncbi:UNVERIFIED_CONTAM: ftsA [Trichonephila clavipes]
MDEMTNNNAHMIVAVDIGTSKVVCLVGQVNPAKHGQHGLEVVGVGSKPSQGMRNGVVVNIDDMMKAIQGAVGEAELMAHCKIHSAYIGIADSHIGGPDSSAVVAIRESEVAQSLEKCVRGAWLEIDDVILNQLAASHAVLTDDEKEQGVCLIDIGAGTTDIAVFARGAIRHTAVIPIAGDHITNDIAMALGTPTLAADDLKVKHACAVPSMAYPEQTLSVPRMGNRPARPLTRQTLAAVVEPRYEKLFGLVQQELERSGYADQLAAGVVMTGGSAKVEGAVQLAESILHLPVRIGMPKFLHLGRIGELLRDPLYATAIGLLIYGKQRTDGLGNG